MYEHCYERTGKFLKYLIGVLTVFTPLVPHSSFEEDDIEIKQQYPHKFYCWCSVVATLQHLLRPGFACCSNTATPFTFRVCMLKCVNEPETCLK